MSLQEALAQPPVKKPTQTALDRWVQQLPEKDREAVMAAVVSPDWGHVDLMGVLFAAGAPEVADTTFGAWRRRMGWKR